MSGIAASYGEIEPNQAQAMLGRLEHRGPDGEAGIDVGRHWLGCRFSTVDGYEQVFSTQSGDFYMVGDGEIYNCEQLGCEIPASRSSVEAVLELFETSGPGILADLDGMFGIVIAGVNGQFVAARDHFGIKPLYWARQNGAVRFASEVVAFDPEWMPFVEFFPPGHYWSPESGLVAFADAPGTPEETSADIAEPGVSLPEELLIQVRDELISSVEQQMMGDTEVAAFLSGGLDSSLIAAIAQRWLQQRGERLKTFAVGLEGSPDLQAAREVADWLGTDHHEKTYTADEALAALPDVIRDLENFDPSLVRSSVANSILSEFVSSHVSVVLTGEGADEIFAGYEYLKELDTGEELHKELLCLMNGLHNGGLQRVDRTTAAHGIEARVPFLSEGMIALGLSIPAGWKLAGDGQPEKRLLREAFEGWLPENILWRKKTQFGDGSGAVDVLQRAMADTVTEDDFHREQHDVVPPLRTREEVAYYRIFSKFLKGARPEKIVGRFATA